MITVLAYLEQSAKKHPDKTAVIHPDACLTYRQLLTASRHIGSTLVRRDLQKKPVAVLLEKSAEALTSFFGISYAGGFYTLLNPELPPDRLQQVLTVLETTTLITDESHLELAQTIVSKIPSSTIDILHVSKLREVEIDDVALDAIRRRAIDTDPLYANFTSGSTGVPKGVVVSHRSVIDFIDVFTTTFDITGSDRIGNQAPFDFDVSVKDIYSSIKEGASIVLIPKHLFSQPAALVDYLCDNRVTTMIWAVSALCLISIFHGLDYRIPETVDKILYSGEVMPQKHLQIWMEKLPKATFVNLYGPTEITCNCTYHIIDRSRDYRNGIPIGKAFPNEDVMLLDGGHAVIRKPGEIGEICVRGTALALGYYNAPEVTAKAFMQNPCNPYYPELIYRTGDLARYDENGDLIFSGRKDFQIKHMGHRIELEEIELRIAEVPGIERCCCVFQEEKSKLYAFYIGSMDKRALCLHLEEKLPKYMIPNAFRRVEDMPLNKNGKTDRKQLMALYA